MPVNGHFTKRKGFHVMKTKDELKILKAEVEELNKKLAELSEDELKQVTAGDSEYDEMIIKAERKGFFVGGSAFLRPSAIGNTSFIDSDDYIHPETYDTGITKP